MAPPPAPSASAVARPVDRELADLPRDPREAILASAAGALLAQEHVRARPIDDTVSKEAFKEFIDDLDVGKLFLLEGDVQKLARFETDMDDELRAGDLVLGRKATALLSSRRRLVADVVARILATPLELTANESIETDSKKRAFCKSEDELATRWRSLLKLQVLERTQELEDILDKKAHPLPPDPTKPADPDDAKRDAAAEKALGEIPTTFEGRRDKVQKQVATRFVVRNQKLFLISMTRWAQARAWPVANVCRPARPVRCRRQRAHIRLSPTKRSIASVRIAESVASSRITSRTTRSFALTGAMVHPITVASVSRGAMDSITHIIAND